MSPDAHDGCNSHLFARSTSQMTLNRIVLSAQLPAQPDTDLAGQVHQLHRASSNQRRRCQRVSYETSSAPRHHQHRQHRCSSAVIVMTTQSMQQLVSSLEKVLTPQSLVVNDIQSPSTAALTATSLPTSAAATSTTAPVVTSTYESFPPLPTTPPKRVAEQRPSSFWTDYNSVVLTMAYMNEYPLMAP
ncbi:uncharacterized protein LOC124255380 isoform X1 [Haliotis rubra]|uniref:uncharacterized protein LOC124255380 isoform X1 n=1 Tax=Haliotis rubra TaxID=36100 RepID=UPI001EE5B84A|nr:uncharacterized protein LOC124255380 isoform X1 [Haliotis rubra]